MNASPPPESWRFRSGALVVVSLALLAALVLVLLTTGKRQPSADRSDLVGLSAATVSPFRNIRAEVRYVGDAACVECHAEQAETYRHHPMGRSFAAASHETPLERYDATANNPFTRLGFRFEVARKDGLYLHHAQRTDATGRVLVETVSPVAYVIGSGTRGRSYLVNREDFLFQSPISWYSEEDRWDLSPGFEVIFPPDRPVEPQCLFCHANRAEHRPHTRNGYRSPIFFGAAIGCERCHGPGELHVAARAAGEATTGMFDDTIVNPAHLEPKLREAVCQQCHLQGMVRVLHAGREQYDYRPGLPLHEFLSVYVRKPEFQDSRRAVGQVEQMVQSRCYQASNGALGCISCHDAHAVPQPAAKAAFYRGRCLECHEADSAGPIGPGRQAVPARECALPLEVRQQQNQNDCVACHMARSPSSNIAHTAITDHRILRIPAAVEPPRPLPGRGIPIINFFAQQGITEGPDAERNLGVALGHLAASVGALREQLPALMLPLLERATAKDPKDVEAWEKKGWALALQSRREEALAAFTTVLRLAPQREATLYLAMQVADRMGRLDEALSYARRTVAVNPATWDYRYNLAAYLAQKHDWRRALAEAEVALQLNPSHRETRRLLIGCLLRVGDRARAQREFETLVALHPSEASTLKTWYEAQLGP